MPKGFIEQHPFLTFLTVAFVLIVAFNIGKNNAEIKCKTQKLKIEKDYSEQVASLQMKLNDIQSEKAKRVEIIYKKAEGIKDEIRKLPTSNCSKLTTRELQLWNALNKRPTS